MEEGRSGRQWCRPASAGRALDPDSGLAAWRYHPRVPDALAVVRARRAPLPRPASLPRAAARAAGRARERAGRRGPARIPPVRSARGGRPQPRPGAPRAHRWLPAGLDRRSAVPAPAAVRGAQQGAEHPALARAALVPPHVGPARPAPRGGHLRRSPGRGGGRARADPRRGPAVVARLRAGTGHRLVLGADQPRARGAGGALRGRHPGSRAAGRQPPLLRPRRAAVPAGAARAAGARAGAGAAPAAVAVPRPRPARRHGQRGALERDGTGAGRDRTVPRAQPRGDDRGTGRSRRAHAGPDRWHPRSAVRGDRRARPARAGRAGGGDGTGGSPPRRCRPRCRAPDAARSAPRCRGADAARPVPGRRRSAVRPRMPGSWHRPRSSHSWRRSTRWRGTATCSGRCSASTTSGRCTSRRRGAAGATTCCRCCSAIGWSARIEPRVDRTARRVRILGAWWEAGFDPLAEPGFVPALAAALDAYRRFAGAGAVTWPRTRDARALAGALRGHVA